MATTDNTTRVSIEEAKELMNWLTIYIHTVCPNKKYAHIKTLISTLRNINFPKRICSCIPDGQGPLHTPWITKVPIFLPEQIHVLFRLSETSLDVSAVVPDTNLCACPRLPHGSDYHILWLSVLCFRCNRQT
jgi:hypothetical protein